MIKRIKIGVVLILIGIGIPLVLAFFQQDGEIFKLKFEKQDKLREAEVKTLNSIYDLSISYLDYKKSTTVKNSDQKKTYSTEELFGQSPTNSFEAYMTFNEFVDKYGKANSRIKDLLKEAEIPNTGRINESDGQVIPPLPPGFRLENPDQLGKFVLLTPVGYTVGIPFNYSIGVGLILIITGVGFVVLSLIGRKGKML